MSTFRISAPRIALVIIGIALLANPKETLAQHGGGGGGMGGGGTSGGSGAGSGRPGGVSEKDELKSFHRAMALQASADQHAAFEKVAQYVQGAVDQLQILRDSLKKTPVASPLSDRDVALDQAIAKARAGNQNFLTSFSSAQKSGLKDLINKLAKTEAELDKQQKSLDLAVQNTKTLSVEDPASAQPVANAAANLEKELTNFQNEHLAIGAEMGIILSSNGDAQQLTFNLPKTNNSINVDGQNVSIPFSGVATRTSATNGENLFSLRLVIDLSDLQQNVTAIVRSKAASIPRCGERVEIQQAAFTPQAPDALIAAHLHVERWACTPGQSPMELSSGDATVQMKLTLSVDPVAGLRLASEITRVNADGFLRDMLRTGDLGVNLREQTAAAILAAIQKTADLKSALPAAAQESASIQKAQFQDIGADQMNLVLDGQLKFSDEQTKQFGIQMKQRMAAQVPSAQ